VEGLLGTSVGVFVGVTVLVMGFAAFMTGHAVAATWKPAWQAAAYAVLLAFGARFLVFALFEGTLLTLSGFLADAAVLVCITLVAYRLSRVRKMVTQYPWLYERTGLFGFRRRPDAA
jgi:hypothetical protein